MLFNIGSIFKALEVVYLFIFLFLGYLSLGVFLFVAHKDEILYLLASALFKGAHFFQLGVSLAAAYLGCVLNELVRKVKVDIGYLLSFNS